MPLTTGTRLGPYAITGPLGAGGMGEGRVAYLLRERQINVIGLWLADPSRGTATRLTAPDTSSTSPVWSPDGRSIVYTLIGAGSFDLYVRDIAPGSSQRLLLHTDGFKAAQSWSPDGRLILFNAVDPRTRMDLWSLDTKTGEPRVFLGGEADECCGRFSPDGQWVAYVTTDSGRPEVFVRPFAGAGEPVQVSVNGGGIPDWRPDGRELYYIAPDNSLMGVPVTVELGSFRSGTPARLFRINTKGMPGVAVAFATDRPYAPVGSDRFLVTELQGDTRTAGIRLLFNWTPTRPQ